MALSDQEKKKVRYHLGYPITTIGVSIHLGIGRRTQMSFMVDSAVSALDADGETEVRRLLRELNTIECQLSDARSRLRATKLGNLETNQDETTALEGEYKRWAERLADVLGVPLYKFSERFNGPKNAGPDRRFTNAKVRR